MFKPGTDENVELCTTLGREMRAHMGEARSPSRPSQETRLLCDHTFRFLDHEILNACMRPATTVWGYR